MPPDVLNAATAQDQAAAWFSHLRSGEASPEDWRDAEDSRIAICDHLAAHPLTADAAARTDARW